MMVRIQTPPALLSSTESTEYTSADDKTPASAKNRPEIGDP